MEMPHFTREQIALENTAFDWVHGFKTKPLDMQRALMWVEECAKKEGIRNTKALWKAYLTQYGTRSVDITNYDVYTDFPGQPMQLICNGYKTGADGIRTPGKDGIDVEVCASPILPVQRLKNVDSGLEKVELAFCLGDKWHRAIFDRTTIASANSIVSLSGYGIPVTSANATELVKYLNNLNVANYDIIPQKLSIGRVGWIPGYGFSPYTGNLTFDAEASFGTIFATIKQSGDFEAWRRTIGAVRRESKRAQMVIAASFASALVEPLGALPFFVHLWGTASGTGKTVALMCAASVWADPAMGRYIQTFNSTQVGLERFAAFCNSLPLIIDEMQLARDAQGKSRFNVYQLAQGVGRTRGNARGGTDATTTWHNCIITSGETPLTSESVGAGAKNRVIEIGCGEKRIVQDGWGVAQALRGNYGHAGKMFVEKIMQEDGLRRAREIYEAVHRGLLNSDATDKQAASTALLITADRLAQEWIFGDACEALCAKDFLLDGEDERILESADEIDVGRRAHEFLTSWISLNENRFKVFASGEMCSVPVGEVYGVIRDDVTYINKNAFFKAVEGEGYSARGTLGWLKTHGLLLVRSDGKGYYCNRKEGGRTVQYVAVLSEKRPERLHFTQTEFQGVTPKNAY